VSSVLSAPAYKGYPAWAPPLPAGDIGAQGWHVLQAEWPLPCATLKQAAIKHNVGWMQRLVTQAGVSLVPHGKTTMSPALFQIQLDEGAWGITFATVGQLATGVATGVRRALLANQVLLPHDLSWLNQLHTSHPDLQAPFLLDSATQLTAIESWMAQARTHATPPRPFEVLIELGLPAGRTGCRTLTQALDLAHTAHASPAVRLVGIECYEGLWAKGDAKADSQLVDTLMQQVHDLAQTCDRAGLFNDTPEVWISAGGSAVFDLVASWLTPVLSRPVRGLLRSGCYITHDDGFYKRLGHLVDERLAMHGLQGQPWPCGGGLHAALEVWCAVQSRPEPHLAILNAGKRDLSFDMGLPIPLRWSPAGTTTVHDAPAEWRITQLNDQHAYLDMGDTNNPEPTLQVGDRVALGISHPCTTFDKWRWMPLVTDDGQIVGAITTRF
jgi:D-serine dehydratase